MVSSSFCKIILMDIRDQYAVLNRLGGFDATKKYEGASHGSLRNPKNHSKKRSFFEEIIKSKSKIPGVAKYVINPEEPKRYTSKAVQNEKNSKKKTYLDHQLKRSSSLPSVGKYDISKYNTIGGEGKSSRSSIAYKNQNAKTFKPTLFDMCNRDNINIGPGLYNAKSTLLQDSPKYAMPPEHKKQKSLPKVPSPVDYHPIPSNYQTFQKKSISKTDERSSFGQRAQVKLIERSPGPIYNISTEWKKDSESPKKFDIYHSLSSGPKLKIYH